MDRAVVSCVCAPTLPSHPGFSITELQRKQAMLNASKQQATGKPKGKWTVVPHLQLLRGHSGPQRCPLPKD